MNSASAHDLRCLEVEKEKQDPRSPRGAIEACLTRSSISSSSSFIDDPPLNREAIEDTDTNARCKNHKASSNWGKFFKLWKRKSIKRLSSFPPLSGGPSISKRNKSADPHINGMILHDIYDFQSSLHNFSITDIEIATDNFNPENIIGRGGYAEVYQGILPEGKLIAVKRLTKGTLEEQTAEFLSELGIIAHVDHPNTAKFIGCCIEGGMHLVFRLSPLGSLGSLLHGRSKDKLTWSRRYKVALGTADGLMYLHESCQRRIIHRDIKADNILLTEDFQPQICDFGLAKWLPKQLTHHNVSKFEGTFGYFAPEYFMHGIVDEKTDVFAFGVLLLELITGHRALDESQQSLVLWAKPLLDKKAIRELVDPSLGDEYNREELSRLTSMASLCIEQSSLLRPKMSQVVELLIGQDGVVVSPREAKRKMLKFWAPNFEFSKLLPKTYRLPPSLLKRYKTIEIPKTRIHILHLQENLQTMTKKKVSRKSDEATTDNRQALHKKAPKTEKKDTALSRQSSMEDKDSSEDKFQNLKSLNAILLKQTMEKRHQIDSLVQAKDELEAELTRYGAEKTGLRDDLGQVSDENLGLKIELGLVIDIVKNRFREISVEVDRLMKEKSDRESEIRVLKGEVNELMSKVEIEKEQLRKGCDERDSIKNGFDLQCEEVNRLKECVIQLEEKESNLEIVIGKLKSENDGLVKERKMREEFIEGVIREKTDLEKTIEEKKEIDGLDREIKELLSVKNEMEIVTIDQKREIEKLEKMLDEVNETVQSLTKEERVLQDLVRGLEKNLDESVEKAINKSELEKLMEEKNSVVKQMEMVNVQSFDKEKLIDQLSQEKIILEGDIFGRETKLLELNQKADELTHAVAVLQKDCDDRTKTNDKLSCRVGQLSDALTQVERKREEADKALDEEKRNGEGLKAEVLKSEKMIESTLEELDKIKIERESLFTAKNDLESQSESLKSEKATLEKELVELKKAMDALKTELESSGMDAQRSLMMLKSSASMVSRSENLEDRFISEQQKGENGTNSYTLELESIEKAFKNKEDIIEEMKKEVEIMKQSTEEAHKKQRFWTLVSSVTTIFAAASFAYAARTRKAPQNGFSP